MCGRRAFLDRGLDIIVNNQHFKNRFPPTDKAVPAKIANLNCVQQRAYRNSMMQDRFPLSDLRRFLPGLFQGSVTLLHSLDSALTKD